MKRALSILLVGAISVLTPAASIAKEKSDSFVRMNSDYSYIMLDSTTNLTKRQNFLFNNKDKMLDEGALYIGASLIAIGDIQKSNRDGKFAYFMRHPISPNQVGKDVSELVVHSLQMQVSGMLNSWIMIYNELLYNPEQSFGSGTLTSLTRNQVQVRKAFVLLGDKERFPVFFSLGKQDIPFGLHDTVSPFSASSVGHIFGPIAYSGIFGFEYGGLTAAFSAIEGGSQFRGANVPIEGTVSPSRVVNYAANIDYTHHFTNDISFLLGGSYIKGSAFNHEFPIMHHNPGKINNPAWNAFAKLELGQWVLQGEFARTVKNWPGTHNPSPPLNVFPAHRVEAFSVGTRYDFLNVIYDKDVRLSLDVSEITMGPKGSPWRSQGQIVGGLAVKVMPNVKLFGEFIRTSGYAPLNNISGDENGVPGTTHSDKGAHSNIFLLGIQASL